MRLLLVELCLKAVDVLLEIAVGDVVVAPVGHSIKLQTVRELHLFGLAKLLELLPSLLFSLALPVRLFRACVEFLELYSLGGRSVTVRRQDVQVGGSQSSSEKTLL